jgi:endonuclease-3
MDDRNMAEIIRLMELELQKREPRFVTQLAEARRDPFEILISTLLSLRDQDEVTAAATQRLFALAATTAGVAPSSGGEDSGGDLPRRFYGTRLKRSGASAGNSSNASVPLCRRESRTADDQRVGRKTANLVVSLGFNGDAICVDTHVHRISNRLGYVRTKNPEETEFALRKKLPRKHWSDSTRFWSPSGRTLPSGFPPLQPLSRRSFCDRVGVNQSGEAWCGMRMSRRQNLEFRGVFSTTA